jgi:2-polyprenyl-3-methyl-5-hydroxy-6-metoxy-1,4-benzoquinol methylase
MGILVKYQCDNIIGVLKLFYKESLSERQIREIEYYNKFAKLNKVNEITFDPIYSKRRRPWNSYWYVYDLALYEYAKGKKKLLEVGCGQGTTSVRLGKIGYDVSCFDISEENIKITKNNAKHYDLENKISASIQTAENLNYKSGIFDIIIGIDILHHIDIKKSIREFHRVLKKDGIAIFREHTEAFLFEWIRNTKIMTQLFPKNISFEKHITEDERKLNKDDLLKIKAIFPDISLKRFVLFSRFDMFIRKPNSKKPSFFEILDYFVFSYLPFSKRFAGGAVIVLKK